MSSRNRNAAGGNSEIDAVITTMALWQQRAPQAARSRYELAGTSTVLQVSMRQDGCPEAGNWEKRS